MEIRISDGTTHTVETDLEAAEAVIEQWTGATFDGPEDNIPAWRESAMDHCMDHAPESSWSIEVVEDVRTVTVDTDNLNALAPLFYQYDGQSNPQPAYVEIDPRGDDIEVSADWSGEIGNAVPEYIWSGEAIRLECPPQVGGLPLAEYLKGRDFTEDVRSLCEAGLKSDAAQEIITRIEADLSELPMVEIYDPADWLADSLTAVDYDGEPCHWSEGVRAWYGGTIEITADNIPAIVKDIEANLDSISMVVNADSYLQEIIDTIDRNR